MKKKIIYTILVSLVITAMVLLGIEVKKSNERLRHQEEMYQIAVEQMISGNLDEAENIINTECANHLEKNVILNVCSGLRYYEEGNYKEAYSKINSYDYKNITSITDEQRSWLIAKKDEIKSAKENYEKEEKRRKEEHRAQEEKEKLQRLKESGIPYVGMSEDLIAETSLGKPRDMIRHNTETKSGKVYTANLYDFPNVGYVTFTARCVGGTVTEVFDGRDKGGVNPKYLTSTGSSSSSKKSYATAEDLYEDRPDDFDSLEDAENYFDDNY